MTKWSNILLQDLLTQNNNVTVYQRDYSQNNFASLSASAFGMDAPGMQALVM
jgi:hypothetical protein